MLPALLVISPLVVGPATVDVPARLRTLTGPPSFRLLDWETVNLGRRVGNVVEGLVGYAEVSDSDRAAATQYFSATPGTPDRFAVTGAAEIAIERAIGRVLRRTGVAPTLLSTDAIFPPVLIALTPPPSVLVISPRTELRVVHSTLLNPLPAPEREALERSADSNGVSSLVAPIGGIATYPAMVLESDSPRATLSAAAHEWVHHYLVFHPLGLAYWGSQEAREINETVADMVGREVGDAALIDLGLSHSLPPAPPGASPPTVQTDFDFRAFMRETRLEVERLLATGQVDEAERYMLMRRDELQRNGYAIRKLNQAYFAFYGSYGEGFAASPRSPLPDLLRRLRARSDSVGDFLARVRDITTLDQLRTALSS